jgi:ABC-type lipoprotein release transport system permease subunit
MAWRNIWRHRRRTLIIMLAMGFTMALLVFYDGLIAGFEQAIYGNAIQLLSGNVQVHAEGYGAKVGQKPLLPLADPQAVLAAAKGQPNVKAALPRINTGGMATNREGAFSVGIVGLDPEAEAPHSMVAANISAGRFLESGDKDHIVIGQGLAAAMEVGVGDRILLVGRATHEQMRQRTMTIVGIYDVGMGSVEKRTVYMTLTEAQSLYGLSGGVTEVVILVKNIGQEPPVVRALQGLPGVEVETWESSIPELRDTMQMKNVVMSIFGVVMLGIAAIGILNLLLMAVYERTREIGILGALGLKPRQIMFLFLAEGTLIGLAGALLGSVLGLSITLIFGYFGIDYSQFSDLTEYTALISGRIYTALVPGALLQRALTVAVIAALAALYPAREASRREPAEALHYV